MLKYNVSLLNNDYRLLAKDSFENFAEAVDWSAGYGDEYFVDVETEMDNKIINVEHYCWKDNKFFEVTMDGAMKQWR